MNIQVNTTGLLLNHEVPLKITIIANQSGYFDRTKYDKIEFYLNESETPLEDQTIYLSPTNNDGKQYNVTKTIKIPDYIKGSLTIKAKASGHHQIPNDKLVETQEYPVYNYSSIEKGYDPLLNERSFRDIDRAVAMRHEEDPTGLIYYPNKNNYGEPKDYSALDPFFGSGTTPERHEPYNVRLSDYSHKHYDVVPKSVPYNENNGIWLYVYIQGNDHSKRLYTYGDSKNLINNSKFNSDTAAKNKNANGPANYPPHSSGDKPGINYIVKDGIGYTYSTNQKVDVPAVIQRTYYFWRYTFSKRYYLRSWEIGKLVTDSATINVIMGYPKPKNDFKFIFKEEVMLSWDPVEQTVKDFITNWDKFNEAFKARYQWAKQEACPFKSILPTKGFLTLETFNKIYREIGTTELENAYLCRKVFTDLTDALNKWDE